MAQACSQTKTWRRIAGVVPLAEPRRASRYDATRSAWPSGSDPAFCVGVGVLRHARRLELILRSGSVRACRSILSQARVRFPRSSFSTHSLHAVACFSKKCDAHSALECECPGLALEFMD